MQFFNRTIHTQNGRPITTNGEEFPFDAKLLVVKHDRMAFGYWTWKEVGNYQENDFTAATGDQVGDFNLYFRDGVIIAIHENLVCLID